MKLQLNSFLSALVVPALFLMFVSQTHAQNVTLEMNGTYDTNGGTIFGESGSAIAYSYTMEYDPSLDTNTNYYANGATLNGSTTVHEWHGYSEDGIVGLNITFGSNTFTLDELKTPDIVFGSVSADFWLDTDLSSAAPTLAYLSFADDFFESRLDFGEVQTFGGGSSSTIQINNFSQIFDFNTGGASTKDFTLGFSSSAVPEPGSLTLLGIAALGLGVRRRRR